MSVNKVILLGRLGKDPELKYTPKGLAVCTFSLATSESYKDSSGRVQESTQWTSIVAYGKTAEFCNKYLLKGYQVFIEGKLKTSSWDGKDGKKQYKTEVVASKVENTSGNNPKSSNEETFDEIDFDDSPTFAPDDEPF